MKNREILFWIRHSVAIAISLVLAWGIIQSYRDEYALLYDRNKGIGYFAFRGQFYAEPMTLETPSLKRFHWGIEARLFPPRRDEVKIRIPIIPFALAVLTYGVYPLLPIHKLRFSKTRPEKNGRCGVRR